MSPPETVAATGGSETATAGSGGGVVAPPPPAGESLIGDLLSLDLPSDGAYNAPALGGKRKRERSSNVFKTPFPIGDTGLGGIDLLSADLGGMQVSGSLNHNLLLYLQIKH